MRVCGRQARDSGGICRACQKPLHGLPVDVADGVCSGAPGRILSPASSTCTTSRAIFAAATLTRRAADTLPTVPRSARRRGGLVKFLLMTQQEISASKASCTLWALERFLVGVGALVTFQVLETGERPLTCLTDVWARLVGLRVQVGNRGLGAGSYGGSCSAKSATGGGGKHAEYRAWYRCLQRSEAHFQRRWVQVGNSTWRRVLVEVRSHLTGHKRTPTK